MLMKFSSFLDKKTKQAKKELSIIRDILEEGKFKTEEFLDSESPYVFLRTPDSSLDFEGVRIYKVGSEIAYRLQKESKTEPYGQAYGLNIEDAFADLISDMSGEKAAMQIKKAIIEEFNNFFQKSLEAQDKINTSETDPQNKIISSGAAGDLSNYM